MGYGMSKTGSCLNVDDEGNFDMASVHRCDEPVPDDDKMPAPRALYETLIVFDWDDTLLCTGAINKGQWSPQQLQTLERAVQAVLRISARLGETMIVTNGRASWVQESCRQFLPGLAPMLDDLTVVSARAEYEHLAPDDPFAWKRHAFRRIVKQCRGPGSGTSDSPGLNLVVLGDSPVEIEAARRASKIVGCPCLLKTVKFQDAPSASQLIGQVRKVTRELAKIVYDGRNLNRFLSMRDPAPPRTPAEAAAWKFSCARLTERL